MAFAGEKLTMRLRYQSFTNILRQDISWFDDYRHTTGKIASRLATDIPLVKSVSIFYVLNIADFFHYLNIIVIKN